MGKKKQIRNLELEIERLRKSVFDREVAIDKLLSDTITDSEKNTIKIDRAFAKNVDKTFQDGINSLVGLTATPIRYGDKLKEFVPVGSKLKDIADHVNNLSYKEAKENVDKLVNNFNLYDKPGKDIQYRHTEEGDKVFGELAGKRITHHKVPQDDYIPTFVKLKCNAEVSSGYCAEQDPNRIHEAYQSLFDLMNNEHDLVLTISEMDEIIIECQKFIDLMNTKAEHNTEGMVTIQAPIGSFIVPPTDNPTINNHLAVIQEELQKEMDNTVTLKDVNVWGHNVGDVIVQKSELLDGGQNNQGSGFITNTIEQEFRLKNHKDIATFEQYEKYIFLSDYHISSPYINQDIVIKEGEILSLVEGGSYGTSETCLVKFPYTNIKMFEEKGLVRRLSPLEICGEPQVCAPAKEEERPTHPPRPRRITELPKTLESLDKIERFRCRDAYIIKNDHNVWFLHGTVVLAKDILEDWINGDITPVWDKSKVNKIEEDQGCILADIKDVKDLNSMESINSFITLFDEICTYQGEKNGFTIPKGTSFVKDDQNDYKSINGSLMIPKEVMLEFWINNKVSVQYN